MTREAIEDYLRYKSDKKSNSQLFKVLKKGWQKIRSDDIQVGDILMIEQGETFPADLILLSTSSIDGICYIQTSSLDGEKTLKKRRVPRNIECLVVQHEILPDSLPLSARCESELPSSDLFRYSA